jgi:Rod binding domain-containing protein
VAYLDIASLSAQTGALDAQASKLLSRAKADASSTAPSSKEDAKIEKAGKDFESILLGSWLQQAEKTFASVPGEDEDPDADSGKDQFQGIAMQALAGSLTKSGGIGIAKMISQHLHSAGSKAPSADPAADSSAFQLTKIKSLPGSK